MKTSNILLSIIAVLLFWIAVNLTQSVGADRFTSVSIDAVGGNPIHDGKVPTK